MLEGERDRDRERKRDREIDREIERRDTFEEGAAISCNCINTWMG